ncbi:hypothetical protein CsSME_00050990 [Camellia sinensis var. sinensis]
MGQAHFSVCLDILYSQLGVKHRKPLEFQHQKQSSPAISLALNIVLQREKNMEVLN